MDCFAFGFLWESIKVYIKPQSKFINELIRRQEKISKLVTFIFILGYLGVPLFVPFSIFEEGHPIETISNVIENMVLK